jgi:hypothetical protein
LLKEILEGPLRYRPRYKVTHEDSIYYGQSGQELYKDHYGLIHVRLDSGIRAVFCPRELRRRKVQGRDFGRIVS